MKKRLGTCIAMCVAVISIKIPILLGDGCWELTMQLFNSDGA